MKTKTSDRNAEAAASVVGEMAGDIESGKPGLPQSALPDAADTAAEVPENIAGKPGLPEPETGEDGDKPDLPEPEPEGTADYEPDLEEEDEREDSISFTETDERDLPILEVRVRGGLREAAEAIRSIRERQLWRLLKDAAEDPLYSNFEDYCQDRLGHSRQWVTHLTNWLRVMEVLERLGIPVPHLTVKAAQSLVNCRLADAGGIQAVLQEAKEDGVPLDRNHLREIVDRRADFQTKTHAAETYAEYKSDLAVVEALKDGDTSWGIVKSAKDAGGDFCQDLVSLCKKEKTLPKTTELIAALTGPELQDVVLKLNEIADKQAADKKKKEAQAARRKASRQAEQLAESLKRQEERKVKENTDSSQPSDPESDDGLTEDEPEPDTEDEPDSEVYLCLESALETLDEALAWEWPFDEKELNAVLLKCQDCETRLAEINAKTKELLADVDEPEAMPVGDEASQVV